MIQPIAGVRERLAEGLQIRVAGIIVAVETHISSASRAGSPDLAGAWLNAGYYAGYDYDKGCGDWQEDLHRHLNLREASSGSPALAQAVIS